MRTLLAVFLYLVAGLFLVTWGTMAFVTDQPGASRAAALATLAPFALVPLVLGALASTGARVREIGIVLLSSGVLLGMGAAMFAFVLTSPDMLAMMPPQTRRDIAIFGDPWLGLAVVAAMIVGGLLMVLRGPSRTPPPA
jgi:hypothetical protein